MCQSIFQMIISRRCLTTTALVVHLGAPNLLWACSRYSSPFFSAQEAATQHTPLNRTPPEKKTVNVPLSHHRTLIGSSSTVWSVHIHTWTVEKKFKMWAHRKQSMSCNVHVRTLVIMILHLLVHVSYMLLMWWSDNRFFFPCHPDQWSINCAAAGLIKIKCQLLTVAYPSNL